MRTTIELPDDVLLRAKEQAAKLGMDINQFIAVAITKQVGLAGDYRSALALPKPRSPLPTISAGGTIANVTSELQSQLQEEEDIASYNR